MRSYPGFCRSKQLEYNPGLTHRRRAGHPRANRRTSDRPSFCGVRPDGGSGSATHAHFNPRTPCGVRPGRPAQLMETEYFNPRTPCGVRHVSGDKSGTEIKFQSTHPLRGATSVRATRSRRKRFQSTHPLRGATPSEQRKCARTSFQSTHPLRGATDHRVLFWHAEPISIHAPLAGCDCCNRRPCEGVRYFNPRTPCGVRPATTCPTGTQHIFQSTHPLRGATLAVIEATSILPFQSTHPLRGATNTCRRLEHG